MIHMQCQVLFSLKKKKKKKKKKNKTKNKKIKMSPAVVLINILRVKSVSSVCPVIGLTFKAPFITLAGDNQKCFKYIFQANKD